MQAFQTQKNERESLDWNSMLGKEYTICNNIFEKLSWGLYIGKLNRQQ